MAVIGERSGEADTLSYIVVGCDSFEAILYWDTHALRPLLRASLAARIDSLDNEGLDPFALFTIRLGMPRSVEPFYRPFPP